MSKEGAEVRLATVTAVIGKKMKLLFDGEETAGEMAYKGIYTASVGQRVLCIKVAGTYVVLGAIRE